jgi:phage shock protein A
MGLMDKAKDAAKTAKDAAQKGLDDAKDAGQVFQLKRNVTNLTEQLGHVVYRQHEGEAGLDSEVIRLVDEIRATKAEIQALEQE